MPDICVWLYDASHYKYDTDCESSFQFSSDGVEENEFKYCPFCGRVISAIHETEGADE